MLIGGSYIPALMFGFRCGHLVARQTYSAVVATMLLAGGFGSFFAETGRTSLAEYLRVGSLAGSVLFGLVPLGHFCTIAPADELSLFMRPVLWTIVLYACGFAIWGLALPESLRPGSYDLRGGSHLLWHLAVLAAVVCFDHGVQGMLTHKDEVECQGWSQVTNGVERAR